MRLLAIDVEGFKSFAEPTHLAFRPGITAVIGPNGAGKSNVTEAIRWVLGEQSIKQLRGKESTDVIFHGSGKRAAARRALVTVTFDNESGRFPSDTAEVAITRRLARDGSSSYLVNGDEVRLLDVQRMLAEAGVGTRTFTVISQGMVDRYLTATPAQRRELFDEATGIRSLQLKLLDASRKLQKTQHHSQEIQAIIAELAPRLVVLNRQIKRYEARAALLQEFSVKQTQWFANRWHDTKARGEEIQAQLDHLRSESATARSRRQQLEGQLVALSRLASVDAAPRSTPSDRTQLQELLQKCADFLQRVIAGEINIDRARALVAAIRKQLMTTPKPVTKDADTTITDLEGAREAELAAERGVGGAQAALEQLQQEVAELEAGILRERGSEALAEIQQTATTELVDDEELRALTHKLAAIGEPDPLVVKEYEEAKTRHEHLTSQLTDVQHAATNIADLMGTLHTQMQKQFAERFTIIQQAFTAAFTELFGGGQATLQQLEEGIEISVTPPGKRSRHVTLLSGGERALTSLALLLAILEAQNPPFIVLDEVDAALDEANSRRFAQLLKSRCTTTQGIVVTHNREIMAVADVLYGVTMVQEGISSVYSVQLSDIVETDPSTHSTTFSI